MKTPINAKLFFNGQFISDIVLDKLTMKRELPKLLEGDSVIVKKCSWPIVGERAKIVQISPGGFVATVRLDRDSENVSYTVAMEDLEKT